MNRIEFLKILDAELNGQMNLAEINQNLQYYDSYIREQIEMGKTEEEVMARLGDPRLIARTILDASDGKNEYMDEDVREEQNQKSIFYFNGKKIDLSKWYMKLLTGMIVVLTLAIIISLIVLMIKVAIWIAVPVLIIVAVIYAIQHIFSK